MAATKIVPDASKATKPAKKTTTSTEDVYRCFYCDKRKHKTAFYKHEVYYNKSGLSPICKQCANDLANRVEYGVANGVTIESMLLTLRLMDKPFIKAIFDKADRAAKDPSMDAKHTRTIFGHYCSILAVTEYGNGTWADSDQTEVVDEKFKHLMDAPALPQSEQEAADKEAEINKNDCIRLIGYDPFVNEPERDKPLLYAQMIKYLDSSPESNEDAMKVSSIIQIVKAYYQAGKIDDVISSITADPKELLENAATLKSLQTTQKTLMDTALSLAKDNGISFAHNNNNSKGANTLSGKLKKMKELDLREIEVNAFDVGTASGMRQVADISNASILDQIRLNENDIPEMIADQRILIEKWERTAFKASEQARILLRENQDLKEYLRSIGKEDVLRDRSFVLDDKGGVNDPDIHEDEFQNMMREDGQGDIWSLEEDATAEEALDKDRIDVDYAIEDDDDDDFVVDPDDIMGSDDEEETLVAESGDGSTNPEP